MNYKLIVETAMLIGEIMLVGGAETYRVEDTMTRILRISDLEQAEAFVLPTGLFLTLADPSIDAITLVKRVENRVNNIGNIYEANNISRNLCSGKISFEEAYDQLLLLKDSKLYNDRKHFIGTLFYSVFFCVLLGGNLISSIIAGINGSIIAAINLLCKNKKVPSIVRNLSSSILVAFCSMLIMHIFHLNLPLDILIGSSVMPLLPGVAITNAIRDTLHGDYLSGAGRAVEAFVSAAMTACGIGIGMTIYSMLGGII